MRILTLVLLPLLAVGCKSTKNKVEGREPSAPGEEVHITPDEMEPLRRFVLETRRVLVAEFVRIEVSEQFFFPQMGLTRDQHYVVRKSTRFERGTQRYPAGTRRIQLTNINAQTTNVNPDYLPKVKFGGSGLEIRAYRQITIYVVPVKDREKPLYLRVKAKNTESGGDAKLWVSGRLMKEKPEIDIRSELIWSEDSEEYKHAASVG